MTSRRLILITGPTASGKTALALNLARHFNTSIISADSRQCYAEMTIGVAKPSAEELAEIRHYFVGSHSIHQSVTASTFEVYASEAVKEIFSKNRVAILAGGTGLYIKAFLEGLDDIPPIDPGVRLRLRDQYAALGMDWLRSETERLDPLYYRKGEIHNPRRLLRALEVKLSSGKSIREFQRGQPVERDFIVEKYAIDMSMEQLTQQINSRVDRMMEAGQLDEVRSLMPFQDLNALQTVGYRELFDHLNGKCSLDEAVSRIKTNTRQYARRQMTWIKKDEKIQWITDPTYWLSQI